MLLTLTSNGLKEINKRINRDVIKGSDYITNIINISASRNRYGRRKIRFLVYRSTDLEMKGTFEIKFLE